MTPADIIRACSARGLEDLSDPLVDALVPCIRMQAKQGPHVVGSSRIGGEPDLPPGFPWPTWKGKPLAFVAQVEIAAVQTYSVCRDLPKDGLLQFYYAAAAGTWGFDPADRGSWRVMHIRRADLERRAWPSGLDEESRFRSCQVSLSKDFSIGPLPDDLQEDAVDEVVDLVIDLQANDLGRLTYLLGYPTEIQGEMQEQCALVSGGIYCGNPSGYSDPRGAELGRDAANWRLLLQVGSESEAGMMWGDAGCLYFWIRERDLADGRFDDVWMILQCG